MIFSNNIIKNIKYLGILQISNYLIPFLSEPYLLRTLGVNNYGKISFSAILMGYFILLTEYGFNLSTTKEIARKKEYSDEISKIFYTTILSKLLIFVLVLIIFIPISLYYPKIRDEKTLFYLYFPMVLGYILFPTWLFQGVEKMKYLTKLNLTFKLIPVFIIFIIINNQEDYLKVIAIRSISTFLMGIIAFRIAINKFNLKFKKDFFNLNEIKKCLDNGKYIFVSTIVVSLYRMLPVIIIGVKFDYIYVGMYSVAEKLIRAVISLLDPIKQAFYPYFSRKFNNEHQETMKEIMSLLKLILLFTIFISCSVYICSPYIIKIFSGEYNLISSKILRIFTLMIPFIGVAGVIGTHIMLNNNLEREFMLILSLCGLLSLTLLLLLKIGVIEIAILVVSIEVLVTILMYSIVKYKKIL